MSDNPLVYVIILNYKGLENTIECIESIKENDYNNYKIIVIDNDSKDGSEEALRDQCNRDDMIFVQTGENGGYAKANNMGIKMSIEAFAKYTCILNNDVIVSKDFLSVMVASMEQNEEIAVEGPLVLDYKADIIQSSGASINFWKGECKVNNFNRRWEGIENKEIQCDYVEGSCLLIRNSLTDVIGLIPENYFLYFEETEWCWKFVSQGYKVVCNTNTYVRHKGSASMIHIGKMQNYYFNRNRVTFVKRNASIIQRTVFLIYLIAQTIYRVCFKKYELNIVREYLQGWRNY